ncbi:FAD/NAD(P)-binding oxidoreductase family protein [Hibiscus syriacus]|uniref:FAD/NAD(P)-binding oxidoreductase family protein n=1 Tax=Hibiscus syriacus TaxID=106335 RepID=A0A6A2XG47_HIBSY|nr:FAD/NAD(P)-binding oxidoreductase family protein [Hibiscus syriacus]
MREAHILFFFTSRQPTYLFNSLIRAHSSLNQSSQSLTVFHRMIIAQKPFDILTLPPVLKSCGQLSDLTLGRQLHGAVLVNGYSSDLANNISLIINGKCGELECAMKVFEEMPVRSYVSYSALMVGREGMVEKGTEVFEKMEERLGVKPKLEHYTSCRVHGKVEVADRVERRLVGRASILLL